MKYLGANIYQQRLQTYERDVMLKYQIFNGLFLGLPFADCEQAGASLSIFAKLCSDGIANGDSAPKIVADYLNSVTVKNSQPLELFIKFLQFIERQVVLFDALEDAAFEQINDMSGFGTLDYLLNRTLNEKNESISELSKLLTNFHTRLVLTAHPTQFYPSAILGVIEDLRRAIQSNNIDEVRKLFLQMGFTRFSSDFKPTPVDEARSIIWFLEHVFYKVIPAVQQKLSTTIPNIELGFWPGGDRDGNPYVTAKVTLEVADKLRNSIFQCYYQDVLRLRRRLTFEKVRELLDKMLIQVKHHEYATPELLVTELQQVKGMLNDDFQGLFVEMVDALALKIQLFGFHFAKLDIRQDSSIHLQAVEYLLAKHKLCRKYSELSEEEKISLLLLNIHHRGMSVPDGNEISDEIIATLQAVNTIQNKNGQQAIERYIISNTNSVSSVLEVLWLITIVNNDLPIGQRLKLEVVPLFETIEDLHASEAIMEQLFNLPLYVSNLQLWKQQQTIMLGFSDGTKDGGYLMANWKIFQAKKNLSALAKKYAINLIFFDGRGGPPSRGGGNTFSFYQSLAQEIAAHEIQLTIQGQTISANFGTISAATFNLEHLLSAGIGGRLFSKPSSGLNSQQESLINRLAEYSYQAYTELRQDPLFVPYMTEITPLKYLMEANIGSRPAKRRKDSELKLEDLRAIPFGGAWMQMKQNILGYYGIGGAISKLVIEDHDNIGRLCELYKASPLFKGLVDNSMQSLAYTNFTVSRHLLKDLKFGHFWQKIYSEARLSHQMLLMISGHDELIADDPVKLQSIRMREQIILPLVILQQFALDKLRHIERDDPDLALYEKIVKKSLATSINASRNSI